MERVHLHESKGRKTETEEEGKPRAGRTAETKAKTGARGDNETHAGDKAEL